MKKIGLFYAPKGGNTEVAAKKIAEAIGDDNVDLIYINQSSVAEFDKYQYLIIGTATVGHDTWDSKHPKSAWDTAWKHYCEFNFTGKKVAFFGLGNQVLYPAHFVDSLGMFAKQAFANGAQIVGQVPTEGYSFTQSQALDGDAFWGLPIDDDTEADKTDLRIANWVESLKKEFV